MELRDYQKKQLDFLVERDDCDEVVGLESPTGSGKSFVIVNYISHLFAKNENMSVVITTGSNNLVFEFADTARKWGLDPIVFVGNNLLTCYDNKDNGQIFSLNPDNWCSTIKKNTKVKDKNGKLVLCDACRRCKNEHVAQVKQRINNFNKNRLIITNHQAFLLHVFNSHLYYPDVVIVDEAHLFSTFYSNWKNTEIDRDEINKIFNCIKGKPQEKLFEIFLEKGEPLPQQLAIKLCDLIRLNYKNYPELKKWVDNLCRKLEDFTEKKSNDIFYDIDKKHMKKVVFWNSFDIMQHRIKYRLFTATLDRFTRMMFGMNPDSYDNFYKEGDLDLIDYTKSDAYIYKLNDFNVALNDFISKCEEKDFKQGLILSTTLENVANLKKQGQIGKYKVYTTLKDFRNAEDYKVLVGSRALFQGIDIPTIQFVMLNKIPFEQYDEEFKKRVNYLNGTIGIDPWNDYTIPFVNNTMIQTTGRLWRGPEDFGLVAISDSRLDGRFKYLLKNITNVRKGINLHILYNDEEENPEGFEEIVREEIDYA